MFTGEPFGSGWSPWRVSNQQFSFIRVISSKFVVGPVLGSKDPHTWSFIIIINFKAVSMVFRYCRLQQFSFKLQWYRSMGRGRFYFKSTRLCHKDNTTTHTFMKAPKRCFDITATNEHRLFLNKVTLEKQTNTRAHWIRHTCRYFCTKLSTK